MDIDRLLAPVPGASPSGIELRNDARFHSLERMLEPAAREYRLNDDGSVNGAAPNVSWQDIVADAQALAEDGRDLRLLVIMVRANYNAEGFSGLAAGLTLLTETVKQYWDSLHPGLRDRPDPKAAALPRLNAIKQLENDDNGLLGDLRFGIVLNPRGIGPISGDDLSSATLSDFEVLSRLASGLSGAEKDAALAEHAQTANRVNAACRAMASEQPEDASRLSADLLACEMAVTGLVDAITQVSGIAQGMGLTLPELTEFLELSRAAVDAAIAETSEGAAPIENDPSAAPRAPSAAPAGTTSPTATSSLSGTINSREDVERALQQIVGFYERTEPSSPIPALARRLQRMVGMSFEELMEEIAPGGLKDFYTVAGIDPKKK